ncbi:Thiol-disulfide oxidoreductase resA [Porphyromonas macacae]|uniref:Thiol-disulfide oxidoreductase resA n=2 Tax=Porphyromonas macacae TaxID=28115 RepID=A0A379EBH2_9PORP|nr:Thiol-disulfide oxidoreductase resA [Porphyromonas macacae]
MKNMNKKVIVWLFVLAGVIASCAKQDKTYMISGTIPEVAEAEGEYVYLYDLSFTLMDSVKVKDNAFTFTGKINDTINIVQIVSGGFFAYAIPEEGNITADLSGMSAKGTPLNDELHAYISSMDSLTTNTIKHIEELGRDSALTQEHVAMEEQNLVNSYELAVLSLSEEVLKKHNNDAVGVMAIKNLFRLPQTTPEQIKMWKSIAGKKVLEDHFIKSYLRSIQNLNNTEKGQPFVDFEGEDLQGKKVKLSEYVGKGHYTLVDFWASWCGPCKREMPNLKKVKEIFGPKGLQIVGVGVWDETEKLQKGVEQLGLTWPQIVSNEEATTLYAIEGIPHIILFAPDGTIVERGLYGKEIHRILKKIAEEHDDKL